MEANSMWAQEAAGAKPDLGTFWVGPWTLKYGWGGTDSKLENMRNAGVTPAIHFYYWGDDISPTCVEEGCWSSLHDSWKDRAGWETLAQQMVDRLNTKMGGEPVMIFMETEFNKGGISDYEPFDGYMADMADFIHAGYPEAQIVMSLGNWNSAKWGNFDQTAAASDYVGIQGMRGSTRNSLSSYLNLYESTLSGSEKLQTLFGKPIIIQDIALSTYPEPEYLEHQKNELQQFFTGLPELKATGVEAIIYRSWWDSPTMDLANYYGEAERHWGLTYSGADKGTFKPAAHVWVDGVNAERANAAPSTGDSTPTQPTDAFSAAFEVSPNINEYWVEVLVSSSASPAKVEAQVNGGSWFTLPLQGWGNYATSTYVPAGAEVVFRATDAYGQSVRSGTFVWLQDSNTTEPTTSEPAAPAFDATFAVSPNVNEWWVEVDVTASSTPTKVEVNVNDGAWTELTLQSWGAYAKSFYVAKGSYVVFQATDSHGQKQVSDPIVWLSDGNQAPVADFGATMDGMTVHLDGSASYDADGDALSYVWDLGDGNSAIDSKQSHTYAEPGTYTIAVTVSDGTTSDTVSRTVEAIVVNSAPVADFTTTAEELSVHLDASASTDADGDAMTHAWDLGDGNTATGVTLTHTYAAAGDYVVTLTTSDGQATSQAGATVTVDAPASEPEPTDPTYDATFKVSPNVNEWWVEVFVTASSAPATVEAQVDDGAWTTLPPTSWGAYAKSFHVPTGSKVVFRATDADGAMALSGSHTWLEPEPTTDQTPEPTKGFDATFSLSPNVGRWWVEVFVDANKAVDTVEVRIRGGPWTPLPATGWGSHGDSLFVKPHSKVVFRATTADGQTDLSDVFVWS